MEYVRNPHLYEIPRFTWFDSGGSNSSAYDNVIAVLANLHSVDYRAIGLEDYGRSSQFCATTVGATVSGQ
jgi:aminoglycoside phosphotransferase (APT) family kinase protein